MNTQSTSLSFPPLPDFLPPDSEATTTAPPPAADAHPAVSTSRVHFNTVRCGCWLLGYRPAGASLVAFDGTMRVECHSAGRTASGDLYQRPVAFLPNPPPLRGRTPVLLPAPNPASGIPVLARSRYRYYVRVTTLPERRYAGASFALGFELWRYTAPNTWALESTVTAQMVRITAPTGFPSAADYLEGDVKNSAGAVVGRLTMGWLSDYFRKFTVEIDTVSGSEQPTTSGAGHTWKAVMDAVGWQVNVLLSDTNVAEPTGNSWSDAEMHAAMLARRNATDLDAEWRYHVLAVKNIDSTPRGIMYDVAGTDSNNVPREGIGIASHWTIDPSWGTVGGQRFGTAAAPYFRTAIHEVGHAMGLVHNFADHGFMCTSDVIAAAGTPANPFPANIQWTYHADNQKQLRHYPDPFVRPGGVAFGGASMTTPLISPTDLDVEVDGLTLAVLPLLGEVPLGAPVRVGIKLTNDSDLPIQVPADLSLKGDFVHGEVIDPTGTVRTFSTVVRCIEDHPFCMLAPGESVDNAMTLLRGAEGALFGVPGVHQVKVEVHWDSQEMIARVAGQSTVMITAATEARHAAAAHHVLATPDAHLVLAIGGDHLTDWVAAIQAALESDVLRPHFAAVEAKRVARRFFSRKPDINPAASLIESDTVMSGSEVGKMAQILHAEGTSGVAGKGLAKTLKAKGKGLEISDAKRQVLDAL